MDFKHSRINFFSWQNRACCNQHPWKTWMLMYVYWVRCGQRGGDINFYVVIKSSLLPTQHWRNCQWLQHQTLQKNDPLFQWQYRSAIRCQRVINPRRTCAARLKVLGLCVWVCVCVHGYSDTTGYRAAYERYRRLMSDTSGFVTRSWKLRRQFSRNNYVQEIRYEPIHAVYMDVTTGFTLKSENFQLTDFSKTTSFDN